MHTWVARRFPTRFRRNSPAPMVLALVCALFAALSAASQDAPKWLQELRKDFANIDKARANYATLHRGLVRKWSDRGHIDDVLAEYDARIASYDTDEPTHYGYGYAYATRASDGDLGRAEERLRRAIELNPAFVLAYFTLGGVLHKGGHADGAIAAYAECVRIDETYVAAHYSMGEVYRLTGDTQNALTAYTLAVDLARKDWKFPHYGKAQVYYDLEDDARAELEAQRALELDGKYASVYFLLGQIRAVKGLDAEALELYRTGAKHGDGYPPKELQNLGRIFAYRGNHSQAESLYRQASLIAPADGSLHFDLAETVWAQGRQDEAVAHYQAAIERDPSFATQFTQDVHVEFFSAEMSPDDARAALDKALAIDSTDDEAHVLYAQVETAVGHLSEAVGHYENARTLAPGRADIYFPLGDIYYAQGAMGLAHEALARGMELNPNQVRRYAIAGAELFGREEYIPAVAAYGKHVLLFPDDIDATYHLARSLEGADDIAGAIAQYQRVRESAPRTEDALVRLAGLYRRRGDAAAALGVLTELVGIESANAAAHFARGEILADIDDAPEATLAFERVVALAPGHVEAHFRLGGLYEERRDGAAIRSYERVIELSPNRAGAYFRLGAVHLRSGDEESVIDVYGRGLALQPRRGNAQHVLAQLLDARDRLEEAVEHYAVAVDVKDDDPGWQYDYARCAHRVGDRAEEYGRETAMFVAADTAYTASILLAPTPAAHYYRGILRREHRQIGDSLYLYSEVASDFEQVVSADPEHVDARYMLGLTYVDMEQDARARQTFRRLLEIDPGYENGHAELGAIAEREQEYQTAIDEYEAELRVTPNSARAHFRAGYLYQASRGDPGTAAEHLALAVELDANNADAHVEYGRVLYQLDRLRAAADQFERALKLDGRNLTANYNLAMVYQYMDKRALAIERFRYLLTLDLPGEWKAQAEGYVRRLEGQ